MNYALTEFAKELDIRLTRAHSNDAAFDLYASEQSVGWGVDASEWDDFVDSCRNIDEPFELWIQHRYILKPGRLVAIPTGIIAEIPDGWFGDVTGRSSVTSRGLLVLRGIIDAGYRGEIKVVLWNITGEDQTIIAGDKIAQMVVTPCYQQAANLVNASELTSSTRQEKGFGSSGHRIGV